MKKRRNQKGFTLMEVMVGIAIVAIISVPLLNMFATSFKVGRYSYNIDNANAVALRTVESFRAGLLGTETPEPLYFDYNWNATGQGNAVFQVNTTVQGIPSDAMNSAFLPQFVDAAGNPYSVEIKYIAQPAGDTYKPTLTLSKSGSVYTLSCSDAILYKNGGGYNQVTIPESHLTSSVFPVVVDNTKNTTGAVEFQVTGMSGVELALFVFGDSGESSLVSMGVTGGGASITKMTGGVEALAFDQLLIHVQVVRLEDNLVISDYETRTYVVR